MVRALKRLVVKGVLLFTLSCPVAVLAAIDGKYQGDYQGKKVTAVLETATTTVTGILGIGADSYLLRAESTNGTYPGQINNLKGGEALKLLIKPKGDGIDVEVTPKGAAKWQFTLKRVQ